MGLISPTPACPVLDAASMLSRRSFLLATPLVFAASNLVQAQATADIDQALIRAAAKGDTRETLRLISAGAKVTARDESGRTALLAATQGNHAATARALIDAGADVNAQADNRDSAFLLAGAEGYLDILKLTLDHGADLKSVNRFGGTALIPAAHHGHVEAVRLLLGTKIAVNHVNALGWTALLEAIILGDGGQRHIEIVRQLLAAGANPNLADKDGTRPLVHARRRGYATIARLLEQAGAAD